MRSHLSITKRLNSCCNNKEIKAITFEDLETTDIAW